MSFLALWNLQADTAASKKHDEFAGRLKYGNKAELYQKSQQTRFVTSCDGCFGDELNSN